MTSLRFLPVRDLAFRGKELQLSVMLPCDAKPVGPYFNLEAGDRTLKIAYLIVAKHRLRGYAAITHRTIKGLDLRHVRQIVKMSPRSVPKRVSLVYADGRGQAS